MTITNIEKLRLQMRDLTNDIFLKVQKRMEIAKEIGEIKSNLCIDVTDQNAEEDIQEISDVVIQRHWIGFKIC